MVEVLVLKHITPNYPASGQLLNLAGFSMLIIITDTVTLAVSKVLKEEKLHLT